MVVQWYTHEQNVTPRIPYSPDPAEPVVFFREEAFLYYLNQNKHLLVPEFHFVRTHNENHYFLELAIPFREPYEFPIHWRASEGKISDFDEGPPTEPLGSPDS